MAIFTWNEAILDLLESRRGHDVSLQEIYCVMKRHPLVTRFHREPWQRGKQPKYQCWIRRSLTNLVRRGAVTRVSKGMYRAKEYVGIAERIYELVMGLPDPEASKILRFVESVRRRRVPVAPAQRQVNLALFRQYRGRYDGAKIEREALQGDGS